VAGDDFLKPDAPEHGDEDEYLQPRGVDEEIPNTEAEEKEAGMTPEEHIGLTPPD
jgi:hypothetical protein